MPPFDMRTSNSDCSTVNPYSVTRSNRLPGVYSDQEVTADTLVLARSTARRLAIGGAAPRSMTRKLQQLGLSEELAIQFALEALVARSRFRRARGLIVLLIGVATTVGAYLIADGLWFRSVRVYVAMAGAFVVMLGCSELFHRSVVGKSEIRDWAT